MIAPGVRVGTIGYPVKKSLVLKDVDAVELYAGDGAVPRAATAKHWRAEAPRNVEFSVRLPGYISEPPGAEAKIKGDPSAYGGFKTSQENLGLWKKALGFARGLEARILVIETQASFTPAKTNRDALRSFISAVDREGYEIVWEPSGPWEWEQAVAFAGELDLITAADPLRDPPPAGELAYFRLGPFATMGTRLGIYDLERLAEAAADFERVFCVFGTNRALDDARNLKKILAGFKEEV